MKKISLTQGKFALVDDADFDWLNQWKWCISHKYAIRFIYLGGGRKNRKYKGVYMHKEILKVPEGMQGDHINRNELDNQRHNLRIATCSENAINKPKRQNNISGFKGVTWSTVANKWRTSISKNRKSFHIGVFNTPQEAALAYNTFAKQLHGEFAYLNKV